MNTGSYCIFEDGTGVNKANCNEKLRKHLPNYEKSRLDVKKLESGIMDAIRRAKQKHIPEKLKWPDNTGSTVYRLVEKLIDINKTVIMSNSPQIAPFLLFILYESTWFLLLKMKRAIEENLHILKNVELLNFISAQEFRKVNLALPHCKYLNKNKLDE